MRYTWRMIRVLQIVFMIWSRAGRESSALGKPSASFGVRAAGRAPLQRRVNVKVAPNRRRGKLFHPHPQRFRSSRVSQVPLIHSLALQDPAHLEHDEELLSNLAQMKRAMRRMKSQKQQCSLPSKKLKSPGNHDSLQSTKRLCRKPLKLSFKGEFTTVLYQSACKVAKKFIKAIPATINSLGTSCLGSCRRRCGTMLNNYVPKQSRKRKMTCKRCPSNIAPYQKLRVC